MTDAKIMIDSCAFKISNLFSHLELEKHIDFFGGDVGTFGFIWRGKIMNLKFASHFLVKG